MIFRSVLHAKSIATLVWLVITSVSCASRTTPESPPAAIGGSERSGAAMSGRARVTVAADGGPHAAAAPEAARAGSETTDSAETPDLATRGRAQLEQPSRVGRYEVIELSFPYQTAGLANPWQDVSVTAAFRTPAGRLIMVEGFFYDHDTYRVRFAPTELGQYEYSVDLRGPWGTDSRQGRFESVPSARKGFMRPLPGDPYRLVFEDGSIANGLGINDCWSETGALTGFIDADKKVDLPTYMKTYGAQGAGFNVFRWNPGNCSFDIYDTFSNQGNTYRVRESKWADRLLAAAHAQGFQIMFAFFFKPPDPALEEAYKRAVRYVMARYGAYVGLWEITNETEPDKFPMSFIEVFAAYVRNLDPYKRIVTNSYERVGDWNVLDARSPHIHIAGDAFADMRASTRERTTGKPVISGEIYNPGNRNWDELSLRRMRIYSWTAFFAGLVGVYWNTSYSRSCNCTPGNMYLGVDERRAVAALQRLTKNVAPSSELSVLSPSDRSVTGYALRSESALLAYLYRPLGNKHKRSVTFEVDVPVDGFAWLIDPATGDAIEHVSVKRGPRKITTPPFAEDIVLQIE